MKYSLGVNIISSNQGLITAVKNVLPSIDHPNVWGGEYVWKDDINEDGNEYFFAEIRFNVKADRDGFTNSVKGLAGIINSCEQGSFVREHRCYHDEEMGSPCETETLLEA